MTGTAEVVKFGSFNNGGVKLVVHFEVECIQLHWNQNQQPSALTGVVITAALRCGRGVVTVNSVSTESE